MAGSGKRQFPRYALQATVAISVGERRAVAHSKNLSAGGLCTEGPDGFATGTEVSLRITLVFDADTFSEPLDLPARVAWCTALDDGHQLGFQFLRLSDEQRSYLQMFLRYLDGQSEIDPDEPATDDPFAT